MIVSLVSGTYNRLNYLLGMIASFRESIGRGIRYEIVIVDGGSTDGTIEWCKRQSDIRLIEQGKLLGAVKAFNEGAYAANGKYVILANDDITFVGDSVLFAITHMEEHKSCGIGCFFQDRNGREFHVEQMPAVKHGRQISVTYGQVCIVRKFLGDEVGWWGDYLHTYGGDNELSCNVLLRGWTIDPIQCACIHDLTPKDALRAANNNTKVANGNHPDTQKWLDKWTVNGLVGANFDNIIRHSVIDDPTLLRVLYLPIYEPGNTIQKKTKHGLLDAFSDIGIVYELDYVHIITTNGKNYFMAYMKDMLDAVKPHIVVTQFHDAKTVTAGDVYTLKQHYSCKWVNWNGDYHPEHLYATSYMMFLKMFDLTGFVTTAVKSRYDVYGINWFYWQIGYEGEDVTAGLETVKKHDLVFLANGYSKERLALAARLRGSSNDINVGLYGFWPRELRADGENVYDFDTGYRIYKNAKVAISDAQWPDVTGYCSNRVFQALFSGVCLFQQRFDGMEMLGLQHMKTCVVWNTATDLIDTYHSLSDEDLFVIGRNGKLLVESQHSFGHRVQELLTEMARRGMNVTS